jgi:hypothetical protein
MTTSQVQKNESFLSKRRIGWASVAAIIGCAATGALPLLAAAGLGGGAIAALSSVFRAGSEFLVGGTVFFVALGALAARERLKGPSCNVDGSRREQGAAKSS